MSIYGEFFTDNVIYSILRCHVLRVLRINGFGYLIRNTGKHIVILGITGVRCGFKRSGILRISIIWCSSRPGVDINCVASCIGQGIGDRAVLRIGAGIRNHASASKAQLLLNIKVSRILQEQCGFLFHVCTVSLIIFFGKHRGGVNRVIGSNLVRCLCEIRDHIIGDFVNCRNIIGSVSRDGSIEYTITVAVHRE